MKKKISVNTLFLSLALAIFTPSSIAQTQILCKLNSEKDVAIKIENYTINLTRKDEVVITLGSFKKDGNIFNCINSKFVFNMGGCAPNGLYATYGSTGSAGLAKVIKRWQELSEYLYFGVMLNHVSDSEIVFYASRVLGQEEGVKNNWSFSISRLTGNAVLKSRDETLVDYECSKVDRKF